MSEHTDLPGAESARHLLEILGGADIYLLDQWMKGRLGQQGRVLDVGSGGGRNLEPFLHCEYDVVAVDASLRAARQTFRLGAEVGGHLKQGWVSCQSVGDLGFANGAFDVVICCAVLHFAGDRAQWEAWIDELWRVLAPKGLFFARLASSIGIEDEVEALGDGRFRLPDGTTRFLADRQMLFDTSERLDGTWIEPLKTTVVDSLRAMTTWCLVKPDARDVASR